MIAEKDEMKYQIALSLILIAHTFLPSNDVPIGILYVNRGSYKSTTLKPIANIVISEIMYNPPESNTDVYEYISIK